MSSTCGPEDTPYLGMFSLWVPGVVAIVSYMQHTWASEFKSKFEKCLLLKTFPDPMSLGGFEISP